MQAKRSEGGPDAEATGMTEREAGKRSDQQKGREAVALDRLVRYSLHSIGRNSSGTGSLSAGLPKP